MASRSGNQLNGGPRLIKLLLKRSIFATKCQKIQTLHFHIWPHQKRQLPAKSLHDWSLNTTEVLHCLNIISRRAESWPTTDQSLLPSACSQADFAFGFLTSYPCCFWVVVPLCLVLCFVWRVWSQVKYVVKCQWIQDPENVLQLC